MIRRLILSLRIPKVLNGVVLDVVTVVSLFHSSVAERNNPRKEREEYDHLVPEIQIHDSFPNLHILPLSRLSMIIALVLDLVLVDEGNVLDDALGSEALDVHRTWTPCYNYIFVSFLRAKSLVLRSHSEIALQ